MDDSIRPSRSLVRRGVLAGLVGMALVAASCSSAAGPAADSTAGDPLPSPEPSPTVPDETEPDSGGKVPRPLPDSRPPLGVSVDGAETVANLPMGFQEWDNESQEPPEPERLGTAVADSGQILTFIPAYPADLTILMYQLGPSAMFQRTMTLEGSDSEIQLPVPEAGTWLLDIAATFGPAEEYSGSGVLRYGLWLQAVAPGAGCEAAKPRSAGLSGVTDAQGCPVSTNLIRLDLGVALPWFHCAPWPPTLRWTDHPSASATEFLRREFGGSGATVVDTPSDAQPTGFELLAGPIVTAASDPEAVFIDLGTGMAERWVPPEEEMGCA